MTPIIEKMSVDIDELKNTVKNNQITITTLCPGTEKGAGTTVTLSDDITNYQALIVESGIVSDNTFMTQLVFPYYLRENFKVNSDTINGKTYAGTFKMTIKSSTELYISVASNSIRAIRGITGITLKS